MPSVRTHRRWSARASTLPSPTRHLCNDTAPLGQPVAAGYGFEAPVLGISEIQGGAAMNGRLDCWGERDAPKRCTRSVQSHGTGPFDEIVGAIVIR